MRKVVFGGAISLDGRLARAGGGVDWLIFGDETMEIMKDSWERFDCMIMGRKTYEVAAAEAPDGGGGENDLGIESYVFSRTLPTGKRDGTEFRSDDPGAFVARLKENEGKDICIMGGGDLAKTLFEAGVIDEVGFNIHPLMLGSGPPAFHKMSRQIDLELIECKALKNGCVYVLYRVKN
jgi:dihydrofolate reductase